MMLDLDGDGATEILLSVPPHGNFIVFKENGGTWTNLGRLESSGCTGVREALVAGNFELVMPEFKEIKVAGERRHVHVDHLCQ
jgi:hypothetical protein